MNANELRELQAPLKARYREEPEAGVVTLRASGRVSPDSLTCKVETGKALVEAGLHPATGGTGLFACSGDMLLEALAACAGVTLSAVATALGVAIREGSVLVEGDLDFAERSVSRKISPLASATFVCDFSSIPTPHRSSWQKSSR
jgi:uncharacterized OsmC-like protein